ncbi:MAG: DUF1499 domain-containing protein [Enhydrobacter sp.]|nr:MAG: DUF1499 domain-containing protein [Enhydrobacter sp.]
MLLFVRPVNKLSHRLARLAFITACVGAICVAVAGPLYRYVGIDIEGALGLFRYGFYLCAGGVALGLATVLPTRPGERRRGFVAAVLAIVIGAGGAWMPLKWFLDARATPQLNDVSTDTADPPALVVTLQMRRGAHTPAAYAREFADLQRAFYPEIQPVRLAIPPAEAFRRADRVATEMGWDIVARAPTEGRLEAVETTRWFGFRDDIVVRIRADGPGSRIDIRSKSRVGRSDLGVNAERVHQFTTKLKAL